MDCTSKAYDLNQTALQRARYQLDEDHKIQSYSAQDKGLNYSTVNKQTK